ncbi:MAG: hypothetical protein P1S60_16805 [Anaerolineae bacterium]|nr:hypothetical protein [Anaerolineae bacterium]
MESCEAYATGEYHGCRQRFGVDTGSMEVRISPEKLPSPTKVIVYATEVTDLVHGWLSALDNESLLGPTPSPGWAQRGITYLGRVIYILRHGTYLLGILRAELDRREIKYGGVFK